jgi:hypothetical protein
MKNKQLTIAAVLLGCASAAQAGFVPVSSVSSGLNTIDIVSSNNFKPNLASLGIKQYTLGGSLTADSAGTVSYYYVGKEAGYQNLFGAWDDDAFIDHAVAYDSGFAPTWQNYFASPVLIGSVDTDGGLLNFGFCANSAPGVSVGCVTNQLNDWFGLGSQQSIAFSASGNLAWIFWDDSGAGPDDNHDDMLIKAVFTPRSVPEPATLGLFGLGLLGVWVAGRRRARKA